LEEIGLERGRFNLVDEEKSKLILAKLKNYEMETVPGGSSANTLAGFGLLKGNGVLMGMVGNDAYGEVYARKTAESGVGVRLARHESKDTGYCITLVTPDAERTFATYLGASIYFRKNHVSDEEIRKSKILHVEGYQLEDPELRAASIYAMQIAKDNEVKVSIDLSDPGVVERNLEDLKRLVRDYADIVLANEKEAKAFTGKEEEEALNEISKMCEIAVVKLGGRGSLIKSDGAVHRIPAYKTEIVNTNGAGDMFAAGFLYGFVNNMDLEKAGKLGSLAASKVVGQVGARLHQGALDNLEKEI